MRFSFLIILILFITGSKLANDILAYDSLEMSLVENSSEEEAEKTTKELNEFENSFEIYSHFYTKSQGDNSYQKNENSRILNPFIEIHSPPPE